MGAATGYASYLDSTTDMGGRSHAAWNENGMLLFASWDPVAGRWGDAAQIANATDARNIQLTAGRVKGSTQPLLLASWESGDLNNADINLSIGFYETDAQLVWSDVVPIRANGVADRNHTVGTGDGVFVITNEVRNDPFNQPQSGAAYADSDLATTILTVSHNAASSGSANTLIENAQPGTAYTVHQLQSGERLLRVLVNGQWIGLTKGDETGVLLDKLGTLKHSASDAITFTPSAPFGSSNGSIEFTFEKLDASNYIGRASAEVFAKTAATGNLSTADYRLTIAEAGAGKPYESLPISFSQAINKERISRAARTALVPRNPSLASFRELSGDGVFGDRAQDAYRAKLLQQQLLRSNGPTSAAGIEPQQQQVAYTNQQVTYAGSWGIGSTNSSTTTSGGNVAIGFPLNGDGYELNPNLPVGWRVNFADISKGGDGADFPLVNFASTSLGNNFQFGLSGSTQYVKRPASVGYRSSLFFFVGDEIDSAEYWKKKTGDNDEKIKGYIEKYSTKKRNGSPSTRTKETSYRSGKGLTLFVLFGMPIKLRAVQLGWESSARYAFQNAAAPYSINRNASAIGFVVRLGFQFGAEARVKLGALGVPALNDFTLVQARASFTSTFNFRFYATSRNVDYPIGEPSRVLEYKQDLSKARLTFGLLGGATGRTAFNAIYWANVGLRAGGGIASANGLGQYNVGAPTTKTNPGVTAASGIVSLASNLPWMLAAVEGLVDYANGQKTNPAYSSEFFVTFGVDAELRGSIDVLNRMFGAGVAFTLGFEIGGGTNGIILIGRAGMSIWATLAGLDITLFRASITGVVGNGGINPQALLNPEDRSVVRLLDYTPGAAAAFSAAGLRSDLRAAAQWQVQRFTGSDGIAREGASSGRLIRAVVAVPLDVSAADLNPDGTIKGLRLRIDSPGSC